MRAELVQAKFEFLQDPDSPVHNGDRAQSVRLKLFDSLSVDFQVEHTRYLEPGVFVTTGNAGSPLSLVVFASVHGAVVGTIIDPQKGQFTIEPTAQPGIYRIYENDPRAVTCGQPGENTGTPLSPTRTSTAAAATNPPASTTAAAVTEPANPSADVTFAAGTTNDFWSGLSVPSGGTRIPLLALYNADMAAKAVALFGNLDGLRARIETGVAITNAIMARARATAFIELVGMAQITFTEPAVASSNTILGLVGQTPEYRGLQVKYRPALTTYVIAAENSDASGFAGVAYRPGSQSAIYYQYFNSTVTPHELGHNFGMQHNVEDATPPADMTVPYSFGWRLANANPLVADVMSYPFPGSAYTFILPAYSDPTVTFQGLPLGDAQVADNARVARENTATVAAYATFQFGAVGDNWITNLSTRGYVGAGDQVLIAGLIVGGTTPKQIVLRGIGPSLGQFGIQQPLGDPKIQLFSGSKEIMENDSWQTDSRSADLKALNLAPGNPNEAALLVTLSPGAYTVILSGVNNTTGVGLVEAYEMDSDLSRFSYWNANQVSKAFNTDETSPLEYAFDFGGSYKNSPVLFQLTSALAGEFLLAARRDPASPVAIDPYLEVIQYPKGQNPYILTGTTIVAANDNWQDSSAAGTLLDSGINGLDDPATAVVIVNTAPGFDYWLVAAPGNPNQAHPSAGVIDVSLYNLTGTTAIGESSRLVDVATRGVFSSGERAMIAGFVIRGSTSRTVVVRALGQTLAQFGLTGLVQNPKLTIYNSSSTAIYTNDDWANDSNSATLQQWGLAPVDPREAAMIVTLPPGAYTVIADNNGQEGVGLIEVSEVR